MHVQICRLSLITFQVNSAGQRAWTELTCAACKLLVANANCLIRMPSATVLQKCWAILLLLLWVAVSMQSMHAQGNSNVVQLVFQHSNSCCSPFLQPPFFCQVAEEQALGCLADDDVCYALFRAHHMALSTLTCFLLIARSS